MNKHPKILVNVESTKESKSQLLHSATDSNPPKFTATHPTTQILASQNRFHREAVCFVFSISLRTKIHGCIRDRRSRSKPTPMLIAVAGRCPDGNGIHRSNSWTLRRFDGSITYNMTCVSGVMHVS